MRAQPPRQDPFLLGADEYCKTLCCSSPWKIVGFDKSEYRGTLLALVTSSIQLRTRHA
jgi:hypothetical protein